MKDFETRKKLFLALCKIIGKKTKKDPCFCDLFKYKENINVEKSLQILIDWIFKQKEYFASLRRLEIQTGSRVCKFYQKRNKKREEKRVFKFKKMGKKKKSFRFHLIFKSQPRWVDYFAIQIQIDCKAS
jgi:hypothetical protein